MCEKTNLKKNNNEDMFEVLDLKIFEDEVAQPLLDSKLRSSFGYSK